MKKSLLLGALLFATPLGFLLPGCGGGGSNSIASSPTVVIPALLLALNNGQKATLRVSRSGQTVTGTLIVDPAKTGAKNGAATGISGGSYPVSGQVNPDGSFEISGTFPAPIGAFRLVILLPTQNTAGSFTLSFNGQTFSGVIPSFSGFVPTTAPTTNPTTNPTTGPTTPPTTSGITRVENISITPGPGFNGTTRPTTLSRSTPGFSNATTFGAPSLQLGGDTNLLFEGPTLNRPARVGDTFNLQNRSAALGIVYFAEAVASGPERGWESTGGQLVITAASADAVSFTLRGVTFAPRSFGQTSATGTFTLSGNGVFSNR